MRAGTKEAKMVDNSLTLGTALTGNYLMQSNITPASSGPDITSKHQISSSKHHGSLKGTSNLHILCKHL
jgi:hypothetical protein